MRLLLMAAWLTCPLLATAAERPNVILLMSDDQGRGETGYYGHKQLKTPNLDRMAEAGVRLDRFYVCPFCMPTRNSVMSGQVPHRHGYHLQGDQTTLPGLLADTGYATAHFGKWHLGHFGTSPPWGERRRALIHAYLGYRVVPWETGFGNCFTSETNMATWDPFAVPEHWRDLKRYGNLPKYPWSMEFYAGPDEVTDEGLSGSTDRILADRAMAFIRQSVKQQRPLLAVVWFHAPHRPVVAGKEYREQHYPGLPAAKQHYFGSITAMDEQVGRIRRLVDELGIAERTVLAFCSDNGAAPHNPTSRPHQFGDNGPFRGSKGSLWEGGVRVPGIVEWRGRLPAGRVVDTPVAVLDYLPTFARLAGVPDDKLPERLDGLDMMPILEGKQTERGKPILIEGHRTTSRTSIFDRYKVIQEGRSLLLFDLVDDPREGRDLAKKDPTLYQKMADRHRELWTEVERNGLGIQPR